MDIWARLLSELKITLGRTPFRDWPAMILLWLQLRRLTTALDTLFTAWREGSLPAQPQPAPPVADPAPASPRIEAKPRAAKRRAPAVRRQAITPAATASATPVAAPARAQPPPRARPAPQPPQTAAILPRALSKNCDNLERWQHRALFVTI